MTAVHIQLPDALALKAREMAEHDGVSLDQFVSEAVAGKLSGWVAAGMLEQRAAKGSREKFLKALELIPNVPPEDRDRL